MLVVKIVLWGLFGSVGLFVSYNVIVGFMQGLREARQPKFRVIGWDDDQEKEAR